MRYGMDVGKGGGNGVSNGGGSGLVTKVATSAPAKSGGGGKKGGSDVPSKNAPPVGDAPGVSIVNSKATSYC